MTNAGVHVAIISVARGDGDARVERQVHALLEEGCRVTVHALESGTATDPRPERRLLPRRGPLARATRSLTLPFRVRADAIIVVDPDLFPVALIARWIRRRLVVACDVYEDYTLVVDDRPWSRTRLVREVARSFARLANFAAARADLTVVADEQVPPLVARERMVVKNLPRLDPAHRALPTASSAAAYVGDVRRSRGVFEMITGVLGARGWELDIVGPVFAGDEGAIRDAIGGSPRIRLHGRCSPEASWEIVRGASVGLSLLHPTPAYRGAMPTKIYEYANAGMAVITSPLPRPAALVEAHGIGAVVSSVEAISAALDRWREEPGEVISCRARASEWATATLGGVWPPTAVAQRILTLVDEQRETE